MNNPANVQAGLLGLLNRRLIGALGFSAAGLRRAWMEEAFRVEIIIGATLLPIIWWLDLEPVERAALLGSLFIVLIVEILNTAVEVAIDRTSVEIHPLSKAAKDLGSAAVLLTITMAIVTWLVLLWPKLACFIHEGRGVEHTVKLLQLCISHESSLFVSKGRSS